MKLLFDQNLSWRLPQQLADLYPNSQHIREAGLKESADADIWEYAKLHGFVIVKQVRESIPAFRVTPSGVKGCVKLTPQGVTLTFIIRHYFSSPT